MKLDELIAELQKLRAAHGDLPLVTRDILSGILGAVLILPPPRIAHLTELTGRQRKLRLFDHEGERGQKVVVL